MTSEKIAILTDSCTDVPPEFAQGRPLFTAPLTINYADGTTRRDRVDITPQEVYDGLEQEIPKTSLPLPADIEALFEEIESLGFTHVLVVTIASGLSGTFNVMRHVAVAHPRLTCDFIDSKSIGLGAGLVVMAACEAVEAGRSFEEAASDTRRAAENTEVYFVVDTLEYLYAGGRIGKATYQLGSILNMRPIITCEPETGSYVTAAKARGRKASLKKALELAQKAASGCSRCRVGVVNGNAAEEADALIARVPDAIPQLDGDIYSGQISPALVVHTGPGLIGIGIQRLDG